MGNPAVEAAIKGLEAIGIPIPAAAEGLIEMLINDGEDVLSSIPRVISVIEQLGGETWHTLEAVGAGMQQYGPIGYVQHQIDGIFDPHIEIIKNIHTQKQTLISNHRATLTTLNTQVQTIAPGGTIPTGSTQQIAFTGPAANAMVLSFNTAHTNVSAHLDLLEQTSITDQQFFNNIQSAKTIGTDAAIITLIIIAVTLAIALVLAVPSGGVSLAIAGVIDITILTAAEAATIAAILGAFATLATGYEILTHLPTITFPMARPGDIPVPAELPPRKTRTDFTPEQNQLLDDLAREFGWQGNSQMEAWLEYLIGMYGSNPATLAKLKAMIRCLYSKGYFDPQPLITNYKDQSATATVKGIWNTITDALQPHDLEGAWKDYHGLPSGANHEQDINDTFKSLLDALNFLSGKIADRRTPENLRTVYQALRKTVQATYDLVVKRVKGIDRPTSWPDEGNVPFSSDIFKNSGCAG